MLKLIDKQKIIIKYFNNILKKSQKILLIIVLLVSSISFTGCCFEWTQILARTVEENDTQAAQSIEAESDETSTEETTAVTTETATAEVTTASETTIKKDTTTETTIAEDASTDTTSSETTAAETDSDIIHGVVPQKVTINSNYTSGDLSADYYFEFWNVGKLGGDYYSDASLTITILKVPGGADMSDPIDVMYYGYFTGGPNGELILTNSSDGTEYRCYLNNGSQLITPIGYTLNIDNPDAFEGWVD
jgi:hypothetical protein